MNGRITQYLFLVLICNDFIQAVPNISFESRTSQLNNKLNNLLQQRIKERSCKQGGDENSAPVHPTDKVDETDGNLYSGLDVNQNADDQDGANSESAQGQEMQPIIADESQKHEVVKPKTNSDIQKFKNKLWRPLEVGDTITPEELLEVTRRLLKQVDKPGKGIVSQSKNEYELADLLFERYFMTPKRIVAINDYDIDGLDAFQALSLDGDVVNNLRSSLESFTEEPSLMFRVMTPKRIVAINDYDIDGLDAFQALSLDGDVVNNLRSSLESFTEEPSLMFRGFKTEPGLQLYGSAFNDYPNKCHYKVLRKRVEKVTNIGKNKQGRRQAVNLKKRLGKNRKLVVNPGRRELIKMVAYDKYHHGRNKDQMTRDSKNAGKTSDQSQRYKKMENKSARKTRDKKSQGIIPRSKSKNTTDNETTCRWKYRCAEEYHLHTCRLHPVCSNQTEYKLAFIREEPEENLRKFREMVGISILDEKVEKIIEAHVLKTRPQKRRPNQQVENLIQYFNKIVETDGRHTTPMNERNPALDAYPLNPEVVDSAIPDPIMNGEYEDPTTRDPMMGADDLEARRILGLIPEKKTNKLFTTPRNHTHLV